MPVNFKKIEKVVAKTISDLGEKRTVTLVPVSDTPFNASQPWEGPDDSATQYIVEAVITPWEKTQRALLIDVPRGDFVCYITGSALTDEPSTGWLCILDGVEYKIVDVSRTRPGITVLLWTLTVAR